MNYNTYKLKQFMSNLLDNSLRFIFLIPRKLYATNNKFKKFIDNREDNNYKKKRNKRLAKDIFNELERNDECTVFDGYDFENEVPTDRSGIYYKELLQYEKWIERNKLVVNTMTLRQYMETFYKDSRHWISNSNLDKTVYIIKRK